MENCPAWNWWYSLNALKCRFSPCKGIPPWAHHSPVLFEAVPLAVDLCNRSLISHFRQYIQLYVSFCLAGASHYNDSCRTTSFSWEMPTELQCCAAGTKWKGYASVSELNEPRKEPHVLFKKECLTQQYGTVGVRLALQSGMWKLTHSTHEWKIKREPADLVPFEWSSVTVVPFTPLSFTATAQHTSHHRRIQECWRFSNHWHSF